MRSILSACRCRHARPANYFKFWQKYSSGLSSYSMCGIQNHYQHSHFNSTSVAGLFEQINFISGMVHLQRQVHLASSHQAQVIQQNLPVSVDEAKIRNVLKSNKVSFELGFTCLIMDCIFCKHKKAGRKSDGEKMYVNIITGSFMCHQCGRSGSWSQLEDHLSLLHAPQRRRGSRVPPAEAPAPLTPAAARLWEAAQPADSIEGETLWPALERLGLQGIGADTLRRFEARLSPEGGLLVPLRRPDGSVAGVRHLAAGGVERTVPAGLHLPAGWGTVRGRDQAVLTARLTDALAVSEKARQPVLALPHGTSRLPTELLPLLERFNRLTLWFPDDVVSWNAVRAFARKLAEKRCFTVRPSSEHGSPLEALRAGVSLPRALEAAAPLYHNAITTFSALRQDVFEEISNATQVAGVQWKRFPALNRLLRGHRRGELTVLSGPTGAGKTTFISEYSLDLCMQGVNTLWGSFEINNTRLAKVMLQQMANCALDKNIDRFDEAADEFEKLPLWFMTFHGQQSIPNVLDAMAHAAYVHDIGHVVLDNLQFMMGPGERGMDRFFEQDAVVSRFRRFATMKNCHVTLVIHPRKERPEEELGLASVFGGARATQEADNVLIMQVLRTADSQKKYIQVLKNRFSGDLGPMPLQFNKESLSFAVKRKPKEKKAPTPESPDTGPAPEPRDQGPAHELRDKRSVPKPRNRLPVPEHRNMCPIPEPRDQGPVPESRDQGPVPESRDPGPVPESRDQGPVPESRDPGPVPESRDPGPVPEPRDKGPVHEPRDKGPVPESRDPGPVPEPRDKGPVPESRDQGPVPESRDPGPVPESRDPGPVPEPRDKGPVHEPRDKGPVPESRDPGPVPEPRDKGPVPESRDQGPVPESRDPGPVPESRDPGPVPEPRDKGPVHEPRDKGPVPESRDPGPVPEPRDKGPVPESRDQGPVLESRNQGPVPKLRDKGSAPEPRDMGDPAPDTPG